MSDDLSRKRELSDEAKTLLENKAFTEAVKDLRKRWFDELVTAADTTEAKLELVAKMKALEAIPAALAAIMNDYKMALRQQKHAS